MITGNIHKERRFYRRVRAEFDRRGLVFIDTSPADPHIDAVYFKGHDPKENAPVYVPITGFELVQNDRSAPRLARVVAERLDLRMR